ncbi:MAG: GH25 family lysozyme [Eubacteriales bacterium]|nr:GH25 family lysozyme [Eubacteriales bacterium]
MQDNKTKKSLLWMPVLIGILLAALVLLHAPRVSAASAAAKGIDVSQWQGEIDWKQVKAEGIDFVMLGIGRYRDGKGIPDPRFEYNMKNALENNIKVGVYLYSEAASEEEAREEADFVLDQIDGYKISYPVAFDIEDDIHKKMTTKQRTDITIAFLEVIEEAGYYPMIYASESWFNSSMDLARLTKYDKWVARWAKTVSFKPLSMWQYSSTGKIKGISANVDLDYSYRDYSKIISPRTKAAKRRTKAAYGWKKSGGNYYYVNEDGSRPKNCFKTIDGKTYYFNAKGYRVTGWQKIGKKYYYFVKSTGVMKTGWLKLSGKMYYLDPKTGVRKTGWLTVGTRKYYLNKSGVVQKGWLTLNKKRYYTNPKNGRLCTGFTKIQGKTYYFKKKDGRMIKGWLTLDGKRYYMNSAGVRQTGWQKIKKKWYYFSKKTGAMMTNCKIGVYRIGADGVCRNR